MNEEGFPSSSKVKYLCIIHYQFIEALNSSLWKSKCGSTGKSKSFKGYDCPNVKATSCFRGVHAHMLL